jgi:hypothetical protein
MMSTALGVLFYARKSNMNALAETPIYMRATIDGQRLDIGTKRFIHPGQWSASYWHFCCYTEHPTQGNNLAALQPICVINYKY